MVRSAHKAAEQAARLSYGRLVAILSARFRDPAEAEDALSEALVSALQSWPQSGIPQSPEAWLLTTAKRKMVDRGRHTKTAELLRETLAEIHEDRLSGQDVQAPDERLALLFVCTHPAIDVRMRAPLMLQLVLGLDARRIASAFLVAPNTMGHRLVRAKAKIRQAGIPFEIPERGLWPTRLASVLDAIYTAYSLGWDGAHGEDRRRLGLTGEAIWLGRLLVCLVPDQPEAMGLLALMLYCEARGQARRDLSSGRFIPLAEQDTSLWSSELLDEADTLVRRAGKAGDIGRYQLEAAIQAAHAARRHSGHTDWHAVAALYEGLARVSPTLGAGVGRAMAIARTRGPAQALAELEYLAGPQADSYQPYWAGKAHVHRQLGQRDKAYRAYEKAIGLSEDPAVKAFLRRLQTQDE